MMRRRFKSTATVEPRETPRIEPQPKPPGLRIGQSVAFGGFLFLAFVVTIAAFEFNLGPFGIPLVLSTWSMWVVYTISLFGMDLLVLWLENRTKRDINRDGQIGKARRPILYRQWKQSNVVERDAPEPIIESGDEIIVLEPSAREIRVRELWMFLESAFECGKWNRRYWVGQGIKKAYWEDMRAFVLRHQPDVWETDHRPTLDAFLDRWGYPPTGPDRTGPDRTARSE